MCETEYASFLIRCWSQLETAETCTGWQGEIEHIQTGHTVSIKSLEELLAVLHEWPEGAGSSGEGTAD
jgi:hypothetical protein